MPHTLRKSPRRRYHAERDIMVETVWQIYTLLKLLHQPDVAQRLSAAYTWPQDRLKALGSAQDEESEIGQASEALAAAKKGANKEERDLIAHGMDEQKAAQKARAIYQTKPLEEALRALEQEAKEVGELVKNRKYRPSFANAYDTLVKSLCGQLDVLANTDYRSLEGAKRVKNIAEGLSGDVTIFNSHFLPPLPTLKTMAEVKEMKKILSPDYGRNAIIKENIEFFVGLGTFIGFAAAVSQMPAMGLMASSSLSWGLALGHMVSVIVCLSLEGAFSDRYPEESKKLFPFSYVYAAPEIAAIRAAKGGRALVSMLRHNPGAVLPYILHERLGLAFEGAEAQISLPSPLHSTERMVADIAQMEEEGVVAEILEQNNLPRYLNGPNHGYGQQSYSVNTSRLANDDDREPFPLDDGPDGSGYGEEISFDHGGEGHVLRTTGRRSRHSGGRNAR